MVFDTEDSLKLTGDSGPYLQYTYARMQGILRKAKEAKIGLKTLGASEMVFEFPEEVSLLRQMYQYPEVVLRASESLQPNVMYHYLLELSQQLNSFYAAHGVLNEVDGIKKRSRLMLIQGVAQVLKNGLDDLGIIAPDRM